MHYRCRGSVVHGDCSPHSRRGRRSSHLMPATPSHSSSLLSLPLRPSSLSLPPPSLPPWYTTIPLSSKGFSAGDNLAINKILPEGLGRQLPQSALILLLRCDVYKCLLLCSLGAGRAQDAGHAPALTVVVGGDSEELVEGFASFVQIIRNI